MAMSEENKYHGKPCVHGHGTLRYIFGGSCVVCVQGRAKSQEGLTYRRSWKGRYAGYKAKAKQRGLTFDLSPEQFESLCHDDCYYCGEPATGVDRIDSSKGYEISNCLPACGFCNVAKNDKSVAEFLRKIGLIYNRLIKE